MEDDGYSGGSGYEKSGSRDIQVPDFVPQVFRSAGEVSRKHEQNLPTIPTGPKHQDPSPTIAVLEPRDVVRRNATGRWSRPSIE